MLAHSIPRQLGFVKDVLVHLRHLNPAAASLCHVPPPPTWEEDQQLHHLRQASAPSEAATRLSDGDKHSNWSRTSLGSMGFYFMLATWPSKLQPQVSVSCQGDQIHDIISSGLNSTNHSNFHLFTTLFDSLVTSPLLLDPFLIATGCYRHSAQNCNSWLHWVLCKDFCLIFPRITMSRINPVSLGYREESPLGSCVLSSLDPSTTKATGLTWHPLDSWKVQC